MIGAHSPKVYSVSKVIVQITPFAVGEEPERNLILAPLPQNLLNAASKVGPVPAALPKAIVPVVTTPLVLFVY